MKEDISKFINLLPAIKVMKDTISELEYKKADKIDTVMDGIENTLKLCNPCPNCNGVQDLSESEDKCITCLGSGYVDNPIYGIDMRAIVLQLFKILEELNVEYTKEIWALEYGLALLRKQNTICEKCEGTGKVKKPRPTAECDREMMICPNCNGSGRCKIL